MQYIWDTKAAVDENLTALGKRFGHRKSYVFRIIKKQGADLWRVSNHIERDAAELHEEFQDGDVKGVVAYGHKEVQDLMREGEDLEAVLGALVTIVKDDIKIFLGLLEVDNEEKQKRFPEQWRVMMEKEQVKVESFFARFLRNLGGALVHEADEIEEVENQTEKV